MVKHRNIKVQKVQSNGCVYTASLALKGAKYKLLQV